MPPITETSAHDEAIKAFLLLVGSGQLKQIRQTLKATPHIVNAVGPHPFWGGRPQALHVAIETKRPRVFHLLIDFGSDPNGKNDEYDYWSPLRIAISKEHKSMRDELIRRGARIGLTEALMLGDDVLTEQLLRPGESAMSANVPNGASLLSFARTTLAIDRLITLGVPKEKKDRWGSTPAQSISRLGRKGRTLLQHLVAHNVPVSPEEYARLGDRRTLASLSKADPLVATRDDVISAAVDSGHIAITRWLLAQGASVNARTGPPSRHTLLHAAAWNGNLRMVQLLIEAGADITVRDEQHNGTPREWAGTAITIRNDPACQAVVDYLAAREQPGA